MHSHININKVQYILYCKIGTNFGMTGLVLVYELPRLHDTNNPLWVTIKSSKNLTQLKGAMSNFPLRV